MAPISTILDRARFVPETRGDPLGAFPSLAIGGRPYNLWLSEQVLVPLLDRWREQAGRELSGRELRSSVAHDVEWASGRCRLAFQSVLPAASALGDPALLAALGVTANLQRTLGWIGEGLLGGGPPPAIPLSRLWCGAIEYPLYAPLFPGPVRPPVHPSRLHPGRRDPRHLANALWCSVGAIQRRCDEAIAELRHEIRASGLFTAEDLKHLHGHSIPRGGAKGS